MPYLAVSAAGGSGLVRKLEGAIKLVSMQLAVQAAAGASANELLHSYSANPCLLLIVAMHKMAAGQQVSDTL